MRINDRKRRTTAGAPRALLSLALAVCLLFSMLPTALGAVSAGRYPSDLTPSNTKVYIKLAAPVVFFTGDTYGVGTTVAPAVVLLFRSFILMAKPPYFCGKSRKS